jgi:pSer/pThr/pTyr-binding forkhead associated (FHA) protein
MPVGEGPVIALDKPIVLIGRDADCDVRIESAKVSRRHCCIALVNGQLVVRDLESTNGTYVNGARVQETRLATNDQLGIANMRYVVVVDAGAAPVGAQADKAGVAPVEPPPADDGDPSGLSLPSDD